MQITPARAPVLGTGKKWPAHSRRAGNVRPLRGRTSAARVIILREMRPVPGYLHGLSAPSVEARVVIAESPGWAEAACRALISIEEHLGGTARAEGATDGAHTTSTLDRTCADVVACIARAIRCLLHASGMPDMGDARIIALPGQRGVTVYRTSGRRAISTDSPPHADAAALRRTPAHGARLVSAKTEHWLLAIPALAPLAVAEALAWLTQWLNRPRPGLGEGAPRAQDTASLESLLERMSRHTARGYNNRFFLSAAHDLRIPWLPLPGGVFQYGWGSRGRWMDSAFTQSTSIISGKAARNKAVASALLRQAGLPVPPHRVVKSLEAAIEAARNLGYPVVVKPNSQDGGVGVSAGLNSEQELRSGFERARQHAQDILVEKHVEGRDYRVYVFRGRAIGAIERVPAGVTGDGAQTVRALVAAANRDPRRGDHAWSMLAPIVLDEEAMELLALEGLTVESVPEAGRFVRLRRAANIGSGGTPVPVFHRMHPDNIQLCERAAQALRLDLAGIDLLMPDIARSWRETGAGICEINAQPQISTVAAPHLHARLLREFVPGGGRIPSALVLSSGTRPSIVRESAELLSRLGIRAGTVSAEGVYVGTHCIRAKRGPILPDTRTVLIDQSSEAILLDTDGTDLASTGLPLDRFDVLAIADWSTPADRLAAMPSVEPLRELLSLLAPHCTGDVLIAQDHPGLPVVTALVGKERVRVVECPEDLPSAIATALGSGTDRGVDG